MLKIFAINNLMSNHVKAQLYNQYKNNFPVFFFKDFQIVKILFNKKKNYI